MSQTLNLLQRQALIHHFPCFTQFPVAATMELANLMQEVAYHPNEAIVTEGELVDAIYLIAKGTAEVRHQKIVDGKTTTQLIAALRSGEAIGLNELGFYSKTGMRTATVTASTEMLLLRLSVPDLKQFLQRHPQLNQSMLQTAQQMLQMQLIKQAAPFAQLTGERIHWLMQRIHQQNFKAGDIIFNEGDVGDCCYFICAGKVEIYLNNEKNHETSLAYLDTSAMFGEVSLLTSAVRNANARALEACDLFVLNKTDFLEFTKSETGSTDIITEIMLERARPMANTEVTIHHRQASNGEKIITLKNAEQGSYYQLTPEGYFVWQQLNGKHTLRDIEAAFHAKFSTQAPEEIYELIVGLVEGGFVINPTIHVQIQSASAPLWTRIILGIRNIMEAQVALKNIDKRISSAYQKGVFLFFTKPALLISCCLIIMGAAAFVTSAQRIITALNSTPNFIIILISLFVICNFSLILHELGHAFTTKYFGRDVNRMGIGWYWVGPVAFVDTSDMWLCSRGPRTAVNFAGIYVDSCVAGIAAILTLYIASPTITAILWLFALINYFAVFKNLNPLLEFDGYYVVMDLLDKPNLRESAVLWLIQGMKKWREHSAEVIYWLTCLSYLALTALAIYLLQRFVLGALMPREFLGISTDHLRWLLPLLAVTVSSLGIWAEVRQRAQLITR